MRRIVSKSGAYCGATRGRRPTKSVTISHVLASAAWLLPAIQPRVVELESGEKNPTFDTLVKIVAVTGSEFAINIAPQGVSPQLAAKAVTDTPAHVYGGASLLVAAR